jgi:hypothetical protein
LLKTVVDAGVPVLALPVLTGMFIRRRPDITRRHGRTLLGFRIAALAALSGFINGSAWPAL